LGKFCRLNGPDRWLTIRILGLLVIVRIGLWTMPFARMQTFAARLGTRRVSLRCKRLSPQQLTSLVSVVADYVPGASCLTQALVAEAILKRYGYEPVLRIGAGRDPGEAFVAHAWVECDGKVMIGDQPKLRQYATFSQLASTTRVK
jgi:hypothetical protein